MDASIKRGKKGFSAAIIKSRSGDNSGEEDNLELLGDEFCEIIWGPWEGNGSVSDMEAALEPYQVLIKVHCCALDRRLICCYKQSQNSPLAYSQSTPLVPGWEVSGTVVAIGSLVSTCQPGQVIVGICNSNNPLGGCAEFTILDQDNVLLKPTTLDATEAIATLYPGILAYSAVFYGMRPESGDTVLVVGGTTTPFGILAIQLLVSIGVYVFIHVDEMDDADAMRDNLTSENTILLFPNSSECERGIGYLNEGELKSKSSEDALVERIMKETNCLGVNHVLDIDTGDRDDYGLRKRMILKCLGTHSTWVTNRQDFELHPSETNQLSLRGSSLSFVNQNAWSCSGTKQSRLLHIIQDILLKSVQGDIALPPPACFTIDNIQDAAQAIHNLGPKSTETIVIRI